MRRIRFVHNGYITGYIIPATDLKVGHRGCRCGAENAKSCKAYCCGLDVELNPLEIAILSYKKKTAPVNFVDYCELCTETRMNGPDFVSPLFALKKDKKCLFNQSDLKCGIYEVRPTVCRAMPYHLNGTLMQKKTCAGYKCGGKLSKEGFNYIYELAKLSKIVSNTFFFVDFNDFEAGNYRKIIEDTFTKLDIPFYQPVKNLDLESICEKMKLISDFEFKLRLFKTTQNEVLEILAREMVKPALTDTLGQQTDLTAVVSDQAAQC